MLLEALPRIDLVAANARLSVPSCAGPETIEWAKEAFDGKVLMSTSFGMQSAVMLHMVTRVIPDIPVVWIDTGYLPPETYRFAQALVRRLKLNLHVYQSDISPARMEALHGRLWENESDTAHQLYGVLRKVEPMQRALRELNGQCMLSGVRKGQTKHRARMQRVELVEAQGHYKVAPLLYWSEADVDAYIQEHGLPYHPLKLKGYETVGDAHSSRPRTAGDKDARATRFGGRGQECGLHTVTSDASAMLNGLSSDDPNSDNVKIHGSNVQVEIYGRKQCRFCNGAKRVLQAKCMDFSEYTLQRFNHQTEKMEPPDNMVDEQRVVTISTLARRIEHAVPGAAPPSTVPQIFIDGQYIGGFTEMCLHLEIPKSVMDIALLDITADKAKAAKSVEQNNIVMHTWGSSPERWRSSPSLNDLFARGKMEENKEAGRKPSLARSATGMN
jgi:phosphoadenosine phosphosulfate reductase